MNIKLIMAVIGLFLGFVLPTIGSLVLVKYLSANRFPDGHKFFAGEWVSEHKTNALVPLLNIVLFEALISLLINKSVSKIKKGEDEAMEWPVVRDDFDDGLWSTLKHSFGQGDLDPNLYGSDIMNELRRDYVRDELAEARLKIGEGYDIQHVEEKEEGRTNENKGV